MPSRLLQLADVFVEVARIGREECGDCVGSGREASSSVLLVVHDEKASREDFVGVRHHPEGYASDDCWRMQLSLGGSSSQALETGHQCTG